MGVASVKMFSNATGKVKRFLLLFLLLVLFFNQFAILKEQESDETLIVIPLILFRDKFY